MTIYFKSAIIYTTLRYRTLEKHLNLDHSILMKNSLKFLPVFLHLALLCLLWQFMPKSEKPALQMATLMTWSTLNLFLRFRKSFFFSQVISVLAVLIMSSMMFAQELTFLASVDKIAAESLGFAPNVTSQAITALILFIVVCAMNYLVDVTTDMVAGHVTRFKKLVGFASKVFGPVAITSIIIGYGFIKNKAESKKTEDLITYATNTQPKEEKLVVSGTDWRFSSLPMEVLLEIKMRENAPLATGKIKVSIQAEDPLKPGVFQVGYGITNAEIKEAIRYGFLPKGSKLPKRLTKAEADKWFETITIPTYLAQVREVVNPKIKLNGYQIVALHSFCHNLGKGNLKILIGTPGRLNDGNMEESLKYWGEYKNVVKIVKGKRVVTPYDGLISRRAWEMNLMRMEDPSPPVAPEPPALYSLVR